MHDAILTEILSQDDDRRLPQPTPRMKMKKTLPSPVLVLDLLFLLPYLLPYLLL
jgi:hypothetical protein